MKQKVWEQKSYRESFNHVNHNQVSFLTMKLADYYSLDANLLQTECQLLQISKPLKIKNCSLLGNSSGFDSAFSELKKLLHIALTIVVSTASCERLF